MARPKGKDAMSNNQEPNKKKGGVNLAKFAKKLEAKNTKPASPSLPAEENTLKPETPIAVASGAKSTLPEEKEIGFTASKKPQKQSDKTKEQEDLSTLKMPSTYLIFCDWTAQPEGFRNPKTQKDFAKKYNVNEDTLSLWKQRPTFWVTVEKRIKSQWRDKTGRVMHSLFKTIVKKGSAKEVLLFFQIVWSLNLRDLVPDAPPAETTFDPAQLAQMTTAMKNAGLAGVTEEHKKLAEMFNSVNDLSITEGEDDYAENN